MPGLLTTCESKVGKLSQPYLLLHLRRLVSITLTAHDPPSFEEFVGDLYPSEAHNPLLKEEEETYLPPEGALPWPVQKQL